MTVSFRNELLLIKAKIAEKKKRLQELDLRANNHIITIRSIVDANAYDEDFTEIELDRAKAAMDDFYAIWNEAKDLKTQISKLEREVNG